MRLLAEVVGGSGNVLGVDGDAALGGEAIRHLQQSGIEVYEFQQADLSGVESVGGRTFDLVFARLLVVHMPDPVEALRRFWAWVKPGGALLTMDLDLTVMKYFPSNELLSHADALMRRLLEGLGRDIQMGPRMPQLYVQAGIGMPDSCDVASMVEPMHLGGSTVRGVLASLRDAGIARGLVDAVTMDDMDRRLDALVPDGIFRRHSDMVATMKRKAT
jgi:SAM-dependent methyltransferase